MDHDYAVGRNNREDRIMTEEKGPVQSVLDVIKCGNDSEPMCKVKYEHPPSIAWIPLTAVRQSYPILLIDYYASRIIFQRDRQKT